MIEGEAEERAELEGEIAGALDGGEGTSPARLALWVGASSSSPSS